MVEWTRILSDKKRRIAILLIPFVCIAVFFYKKCSGDFGALVSQACDYRTLLEIYKEDDPAKIAHELSAKDSLTENEARLLAQAKHLCSYETYLNNIQLQANNMQLSSVFAADKNTFVYRNIVKTAQDFAACSGQVASMGNFRAVQDWLEFSVTDWGFLAVILLLVMAFTDERQKELAAIVRTCASGRIKLQGTRACILLVYSASTTLLLYYLPLTLSLCLDGGWKDLQLPVQSLMEFQKCTATITVAQFLVRFFFVKTFCGFFIGAIIWYFASFLAHPRLCWLMTVVGLAVEYLLYTKISAQSTLSLLRYINVFSYVFTGQLYTEYININFFGYPTGHRAFLLWFLIIGAAMLIFGILWVLGMRYPFGNRDRMGKWIHLWNQIGDYIRRPFGLLGFEWYKLLLLSAGGIVLVLGMLLSRNISYNSGMYDNPEDVIYRQYVAEIQGPVDQRTWDYLKVAEENLTASGLDTTAYELALDRLEQEITGLGQGNWLVDETGFMNIYGGEAWRLQRKNGLIAIGILTLCLSHLFVCDLRGDIKRILHSSSKGRNRLFWTKYEVAMGITAWVWLWIYGREGWHTASFLGDAVLAAPCSSIELLKNYPMTIGSFVALHALSRGLILMVSANICIYIGAKVSRFETGLLLNGIVILLPAAIYSLGANVLNGITPLTILSDGNPLVAGGASWILAILWLAISFFVLFAGNRTWCRKS